MLKRNAITILQYSSRVMLLTIVVSCSTYKSNWSCKNPTGLGCTSVFHADELARKHIVLNSNTEKKKVLIKEHYSDFKKYKTKLVEID
ncbi:MAG: hypothetical protein RLN62_02650 [Rickettsiales bacterium]